MMMMMMIIIIIIITLIAYARQQSDHATKGNIPPPNLPSLLLSFLH